MFHTFTLWLIYRDSSLPPPPPSKERFVLRTLAPSYDPGKLEVNYRGLGFDNCVHCENGGQQSTLTLPPIYRIGPSSYRAASGAVEGKLQSRGSSQMNGTSIEMAYSITDGRGPDILASSGAMIALSTIAVGLRLWGRSTAPNTGLWWDDWLSLAALPCVLALCALSIYCVYLGLGQHVVNVHTSLTRVSFVFLVMDFFYITGLTLVKLSVLMFYARVFRTVQAYRIALWIIGFTLVAWCIIMNFVVLFGCKPIQKSWDPSIPGHCLDGQKDFIGAAIPNVLTDLILLILPIPILWHLKLSVYRKIGLIGIFAAGYLVLILSIVRFVFIFQAGNFLAEDLTWNVVTYEILLVCEVSVALISSCIPSLFNLAKNAAQKSFWRLFSRSDSSNQAAGRVNIRIGAIRKSIKERRSDFVQLEDAQETAGASNERLVGNADQT
ncbi:hypothetical protein GJ744_011732 [Endocarpon pusillum]|uniref:Rhodopsin domain-containing protein n=1 Tax=Endocarpon pusillum TaxID=364733 RepID=A0A8H7AGA4_9EURO|nr:hypothetical protein GJ744_011732 [Endocarpon pusillum]